MKEIQERESSTCSQWKLHLQFLGLTGLCFLVNILRGTPNFPSIVGLSTCEASSWAIMTAFILIAIAITCHNIRIIMHEIALKEKFGVLHESESWMKPRNLPFMIIASFMSGFVGQIFGLGGAFIYGPLLITIGVNPLVSASTCLYMMIFTTGVSMFMFFIYGNLNVSYMLFLAIWTVTGVLLGVCATKHIMKRYNRPSLVAFALAIAVAIATTISITSSVKSLA